MASVNEGFQNDEIQINESVLNEEDGTKIDYSKAQKKPQITAAIAAAVTGIVLGTILGWASPVQTQLQGTDNTGDPNSIWYLHLTEDEMSWVSSLVTLGALFGGMTGGIFMDLWGRKTTLILICAPYVLSWLLLVVSINPSMLYVARIIAGFAGGICSVVCPCYLGEISTPPVRGVLGCFFQLSVCVGLITSSVMGLGLGWRLMSAVLEIFPVIAVFGLIFVPESPYYLLKKGLRNDAINSLRWLRGNEFDVELEISELEISVENDMAVDSKASDLLRPWAYRPIIVALLLMIFQQVSGINAVLFNAVDIFIFAGSTIEPLVANILINVIQLVVALLCSAFIERLGRRVLFMTSQLICGVSICVLGVFFYLQRTDSKVTETIGWLPLASLMIYIAGFSVGSGPIPWLMTGEVVPRKVKSLGVSLATLTNWGLAFIVTKTFVYIKAGLTDAGAFWMFGGFCFLGFFFAIFFLPETKNKSQDEIQAFFGSKTS